MYYHALQPLAVKAQLMKATPHPTAPAQWLSEEEVQRHVGTLTATLNSLLETLFSLSYCADPALTLKCAGGLLGLAWLSRLLGTVGVLFLAFVGTLGLPKNSPPFWFSLMKARPVLDGLFVSTLADKGSAGVPLAVRGHGAAHTAFIDVRFDRHTFSSIKVGEMVGTYDASTLRPLDSTIRLVRPCARRTGVAASPRAPACSASPHALPRTPDAPRARRGAATHRRASGMPTPCSRPSSNR